MNRGLGGFAAAVKRGIAAADRGDFVEPREVWARVERLLWR